MAALFLDSSAAAKLYVREVGTAWVITLADPRHLHELFILRITLVEVAAALFRRVRAGTLSRTEAVRGVAALQANAQRTFLVVEFTPDVAMLALTLAERHGLRAYDCVQLAGALLIHRQRAAVNLSPLTLVSADAELNAAAMAEGLPVEDPNAHP